MNLQASIVLTKTATSVSGQVQTSERGEFRFSSLAPADYDVIVSANGFTSSKTSLKLLTNQTMDLPVTLTVSGQSQSIQVTDRAPVLDTADSRTQLTIDAEAPQSSPENLSRAPITLSLRQEYGCQETRRFRQLPQDFLRSA